MPSDSDNGVAYIILDDFSVGGESPVIFMSVSPDTELSYVVISCNDPSDDIWYLVDGKSAVTGSLVESLPCSVNGATTEDIETVLYEPADTLANEYGINVVYKEIEQRYGDANAKVVARFVSE